jgi:hypothetical protein
MNQKIFEFIPKNQYFHFITPEMILHIECSNRGVSSLYFTDKEHQKINIPETIQVYTYDYQDTKKRILLQPYSSMYFLGYTDHYDIEYQGKRVFQLKNKRCWDIILPNA